MSAARNKFRKEQAAQAHPAHKSSQQYADGYGRRPDHEFQKLEPNDFVNQCSATAADKHEQQQRENTDRTQGRFFFHGYIIDTDLVHWKSNSLEWTVDAIMPCLNDAWDNPPCVHAPAGPRKRRHSRADPDSYRSRR